MVRFLVAALAVGIVAAGAFLLVFPEGADARGLVPCGGCSTDIDPATGQCPLEEKEPACGLCHLFQLVHNVIEFFLFPSSSNGGFAFVPLLAALLIAAGGFLLLSSAASPQNLARGKNILFAVVIGLIIIYGAWAGVNTFFDFLGVTTFSGAGGWWEIACPVPATAPPPVASWRFNESGGVVASNSAGTQNGTLILGGAGNVISTAAWVPGKTGNSVYLDGVDDSVQFGASPVLFPSAAFTVAVSVNLDALPNAIADITQHIGKSSLGIDTSRAYLRTTADNRISFTVTTTDDGPQTITSATSLAAGTWYRIAGVYDGSHIRLYVNGVPEASLAASGKVDWGPLVRFQLGGGTAGTHASLNGRFDNLRIWDVGLAADEVAGDFAAGL